MPRNITVTFADGTSHVYQNAPDDVTPDQITARAKQEFGKEISALDGGRAGGQQPTDVNVTDTGEGPYDPQGMSAQQTADLETQGFRLNPQSGMYERAQGQAQGADPFEDDSRLNAFVNGLIKPVDNLVSAARQIPGVAAADDAISGMLGIKSGGETVQANDTARADDTRTGYQMMGNIAGTLPTLALPGGALVQGGAAGALLSDGNNAFDVGKDALLGAALSKGGEVALRGLARTASPQISGDLRTLIDAGVEVTPGQMARSMTGRGAGGAAWLEDKATSLPFVGGKIVADRNRSLETFGRATINRALEPIGETLPSSVAGRRAVQYAGDKLGDAYDAILPRLSATGDQKFMQDLSAIHQEAANMLPDRLKQYNNILKGLGRYWNEGVNLDGRALKEIETRIGDRVRRAAMSTDADQRELGDRLGDVLGAVRDLAARQNPTEAEALTRINQGWKSLTQVERAAGNSAGDITPAGYSRSVKQSSDTVRRRGYARGEALNQDLADAASNILPSEIADSGTATRAAAANLPSLLIGAASYPAYQGIKAGSRLLTRDPTMTSDALARLLRYGAAATPVIAPASIHAISK